MTMTLPPPTRFRKKTTFTATSTSTSAAIPNPTAPSMRGPAATRSSSNRTGMKSMIGILLLLVLMVVFHSVYFITVEEEMIGLDDDNDHGMEMEMEISSTRTRASTSKMAEQVGKNLDADDDTSGTANENENENGPILPVPVPDSGREGAQEIVGKGQGPAEVVGELDSTREEEEQDPTPRKPRKVVLLGAHDRYNFGDLLFEKVLSKLLQTRGGYPNEDILRGGIVSVDMSAYGGHDNILNMKHIQNMSRTDEEQGPYDIIYTGGETAACSHDCALSFLPNARFRQMARRDKVSDCGYLIPKKVMLRPSSNPTTSTTTTTKKKKKNYAIGNSLGGHDRATLACKEAIDTADYVTYRDHEPFAPDSAVMIRELYGEYIDRTYSKEVLKELFPNNNDIKKYIAVHHKIDGLNVAELARTLDEVSKGAAGGGSNGNGNVTIVLFAAGTAPGHDSIALYHRVRSAMTQPAIVYEAEHAWKVVALISNAEAVLSTSLHVRIMAFIYHKPRGTWCTETKHRMFIQRWDASDASGCISTKADTWSTLRKYMTDAEIITQEETKKAYKRSIEMYLDSFDKWSKLLEGTNKS